MGCVQGSHKLVLLPMREKVLLFSFQATPRQCRQQQICRIQGKQTNMKI